MFGVFPHSSSESFVPTRDTDEGEKQITLLGRDQKSQSHCRASSLLGHAFANVNIIHRTSLFVSRPVSWRFYLLGNFSQNHFHFSILFLKIKCAALVSVCYRRINIHFNRSCGSSRVLTVWRDKQRKLFSCRLAARK